MINGLIKEPRSEFVGRRRELDALGDLLPSARLVTLAGVGGVGKTRLAMRAVNEFAQGRSIPCWFVPLESVQDPQRVPLAVMRALPRADQSVREPLDVIIDALHDRDVVLVLDNCEHLIDAAAAFADSLLSQLPRLRIVATSRRPLDVDGEHVYPVPPLSTDRGGDSDAVHLLHTRARAADATFSLPPSQVDTAADLVAALDGLPLAIELAATRLRTLSLAELADRLSSRFHLLRGGPRTAVARQQTLRAVVDWSYELCDATQREMWMALSVFAGPFDLAAARAVMDVDDETAIAALDELVAQSIVEADRDSGRFRLLETIRDYGRERAVESGRWPALLRRHLEHFAHIAARSHDQWYGPGQAQRLEQLRADRAELYLALTTATTADPAAAAALYADLSYHWTVSGFLPEARDWEPRVLGQAHDDPSARMRALIAAAWARLLLGDLDDARRHLDEAATHLEHGHGTATVTDPRSEIALHRMRGSLAMFSGDPHEARRQFELSIMRAEAAGMPEETLLARFQLTTALTHVRDPRASEPAQRALQIADASGDAWMRSHALWALGLASFVAGGSEAARRFVREAFTSEATIDDPVGTCLMLELAAWATAERAPERAAMLVGAAGTNWRRIGSSIAVHGPQLEAHHTACVAALRERLGPRAQEQHTETGSRLSRQDAITLALQDDAQPVVLSARERDVASRIRDGKSNREIAQDLVLSVRTIDTHVQRILGKLGFASRTQIAAWYEATFVAES